MYLIDTNIFLEILLDQGKSSECEELLFSIGDLEKQFFVSGFTLHSIEVIMSREGMEDDLEDFLQDMDLMDIQVVNTTVLEEYKTVSLMKETELDFDDSFQYFICRKMDLDIISYDDHFDQVDVERITPEELT